jgi:primosomal protein N'
MSIYCEVVVNRPILRHRVTSEIAPPIEGDKAGDLESSNPLEVTFSYAIPEDLRGQVAVGQLVEVPFRSGTLQGVIVGLSQTPPPDVEIRPITSILDPVPALNPRQIALARWISARYLAHISYCLWLCLPPGTLRPPQTVVEAVPDKEPPPDLDARARALLLYLRGREDPTPANDLETGPLKVLSDIELVRARQRLAPPRVGPQIDRTVELIATPEEITIALPTLGRASKQADVLLYLANLEDPVPALEDVLSAVGCSEGPIRALEKRGWVKLTPKQYLVATPLSGPAIEAALDDLVRAAVQRATLAFLGKRSEPIETSQVKASSSVLAELEAKGYIRRWTEPATVSLNLEADEVLRAILELRGSTEHTAVLDLLEREEGPIWVGWVYAQTNAKLDTLQALAEAGLVAIDETRRWRDPLTDKSFVLEHPPRLTPEQDAAWKVIREAVGGAGERGSGKSGSGESGNRGAGNQGIRESGNRGIRESGNQGIGESGNQGIRESGNQGAGERESGGAGERGSGRYQETNLPTHQSTNLPTYQSTNLPTHQSSNLPIYQSTNLPASHPHAFLLHGVTGSGKTEIYLRAIAEALEQGRGAMLLVPEIALAAQTVQRVAARFPGQVAVWHSNLSLGERYDTWQRVRDGALPVVVGARSALFAPIPNLGVILVDEEHEPAYKAGGSPRYHAREVALQLARLSGAPVILGSATPDVDTFRRAERGELKLLTLPKRVLAHRQHLALQARSVKDPITTPVARPLDRQFHELSELPLPHVEVVDLREELKAGNRTIFSRALQRAIRETLDANQQVILFLNRRGAATFVLCRDCGHVMKCPRCETPLTFHTAEEALLCHHCNRRQPNPDQCPVCRGSHIRYFGLGTERVEAALREMFPRARPLRWDLDTSRTRGSHSAFLQHFIEGRADVLVGTQMIAKGLDLPRVTLVGVVSADTALYLPDFRSAERTFQLLTQVAGRAGRSPLGGRVILQTYNPDLPVIRAAAGHDYAAFYKDELAARRAGRYPPFKRLARLVFNGSGAQRAQHEAEQLANMLRGYVNRQGIPAVEIIGPAPCFYRLLRGQHRWHILVRANEPEALLQPIALPLGWRVDVDPMDLL